MRNIHQRDYTKLLQDLAEEYSVHAPTSAALNQRALKSLVDGGSHMSRLIDPFPPRIASAKGSYVIDEDNNHILDFWQGHYANILGHNPPQIIHPVIDAIHLGIGLQTGFTDRLQIEVAEILTKQTGMEKVRFTTSGTLATMNAILLARAYTGRNLILKVGGGWHGGHIWGLKGVGYQVGFEEVDSLGIPRDVAQKVIVTGFNQPEILLEHFKSYGDQFACFIVEPVIGTGGMMPADREYLQLAQKLCNQYGAVLILDEVISGFRYRAGSVAVSYGIRPDLLTLGKVIGGGMPVAAVAGREKIMQLLGRAEGRKVGFSGGTYSGHPASMLAAKTMITYLVENERSIYSQLDQVSCKTRQMVSKVFEQEGINAQFTGGDNDVIKNNSLHMLCFPHQPGHRLNTPEKIKNPEVCDVVLSEVVMKLAMLVEDVHIVHGLGCTTYVHNHKDIQRLCGAYQKVIRRITPYL